MHFVKQATHTTMITSLNTLLVINPLLTCLITVSGELIFDTISKVIMIIIMMGSYNARLIYPIGYSRRRCGATAALIRQQQNHPHNEEPEIRNRILWKGVRFLGVGGNRSARRKPTKVGMESANQIHIQPLASCIGERKVYEH